MQLFNKILKLVCGELSRLEIRRPVQPEERTENFSIGTDTIVCPFGRSSLTRRLPLQSLTRQNFQISDGWEKGTRHNLHLLPDTAITRAREFFSSIPYLLLCL